MDATRGQTADSLNRQQILNPSASADIMELAQIAIPNQSSTAIYPHIYRLLVVDDDVMSAQIIQWTLESLGHMAQIAHDGATAIKLARSYQPDIVMLDIGLPGMNGYELCEAMRKEPIMKNAFFVAQTGWGETEYRDRSRQAGFDYHLVKPLDTDVIKNVLFALSKGKS